VAARLKVPTDCSELAEVAAREHGHVHASGSLDGAALLRLLERCDALRRPARFADLLLACECDARGRTGHEDRPYAQRDRLLRALALARGVDTAGVAAEQAALGRSGPAVGAAIREARVAALRAMTPA
jgi:tRNA nucleotidyltransferase (CCA-adding enzyme)